MSRRVVSLLVILLFVNAVALSAGLAKERIRPYKPNPFYWEYDGKAVLLIGGSDEDNLFNNPDLMMKNLETLKKCGGNYIRCTLSCRDEGNVWPFEKAGERYDLKRFNGEFWDRLKRCCEECLKRDIILQIEIWATFDFYRENWLKNPWNPVMNSNYTTENTRLEKVWNHHPAGKAQPFFYSPPGRNNDRVLLSFQEAFVRKVLDVTLPFPNVLYCLDNETATPPQWAWYWGAFIRKEGKKRKVGAQLTEMWDDWDLRTARHRATYERPELFSYTDVSQNNWQTGQTHYDRLMWFRQRITEQKGGIRPMNNVKVYSRQGGSRPNSVPITLDRWWQNIFAGCASTRFHRPTGGIGLNEEAQRHIRAARQFFSASRFNIFRSEPRPDLLLEKGENEAHCLAISGRAYALYFPSGGEVVLKAAAERDYTIRCFDVATTKFVGDPQRSKGPRLRIKTPNTEQMWLAIVR